MLRPFSSLIKSLFYYYPEVSYLELSRGEGDAISSAVFHPTFGLDLSKIVSDWGYVNKNGSAFPADFKETN